MSTIPTYRPALDLTERLTETEQAADAVAETVRTILSGDLPGGARALARPLPIAFLDDGRRVFLVVEASRAARADQIDRPRSWGVEVTTEGDLVGATPEQSAVRSTQRMTPEAAAAAASYLLTVTAA